MPESLNIVPTSRRSADCPDVVLRQTTTTRLIFRPLLVDNANNPEAPIRGGFIYQRKNQRSVWEDTKAIDLSSLKAGEGVKIKLHAGEVHQLFSELKELYRVFAVEGIPSQATRYVRISGPLAELAEIGEDSLREYLNAHTRVGSDVLSRLLRWAIDREEAQELTHALDLLTGPTLERLGSAVTLNRLRAIQHLWEAHRGNHNEEFWQSTLRSHFFILSQVFAYPVLILNDRAYVGGKGVGNKGGGIVDFLCRNAITENVALIEIKTPKTRLLTGEYRDGVPNISAELSGAIVQVACYRDTLLKTYAVLRSESEVTFEVFQPECVVLIGDAGRELRTKEQRRSFELFRSGLVGVRVITYDELFGKVTALIDTLGGSAQDAG